MKQIRRHLTYANVMSSVAVFLVLSGATAFAATKIGAGQLKANSVKTGKIVKEAVTAGKIKNGAVVEVKLADNAVTTAKIAKEAVNSDKLGPNAVTTPKIAKEAVISDKIGPNAVNTAKLAGQAVSNEKLAPDVVTTGKIANLAVTTEKLNNSVVTAPKFGAATFTLGGTVNAPVGVSNSTFECPAGQRMLSGGMINTNSSQDLVLIGSHPNNANQWRVQVDNNSAGTLPYRIVVHCLQP